MNPGHPSLWLWIVVDALAAFRLTRLVNKDAITESLRRPFRRSDKAFDFITCPWCVGMWVSGAVVLLSWGAPRVWIWIALVLVLSAVVGLLAEVAG